LVNGRTAIADQDPVEQIPFTVVTKTDSREEATLAALRGLLELVKPPASAEEWSVSLTVTQVEPQGQVRGSRSSSRHSGPPAD
jgi:hypothetical protein